MTLNKVRDEVRQLDEEMLRLLVKRMALASRILEEKKKMGLEINDDQQNEIVIKRAMELATELNLDPEDVKELFQVIIRMSIEWQRQLSGEGNLP